LPYYAERFTTVEINYTFYRNRNEKILPAGTRNPAGFFRLTSTPSAITHTRAQDCADCCRTF